MEFHYSIKVLKHPILMCYYLVRICFISIFVRQIVLVSNLCGGYRLLKEELLHLLFLLPIQANNKAKRFYFWILEAVL